MAHLKHEIWIDADGLESCFLAGTRGAEARKFFLGAGSRLVHTFEAGSHLEAMQYYHSFLGREPYQSSFPVEDGAPYPDEWLEQQAEEPRPAQPSNYDGDGDALEVHCASGWWGRAATQARRAVADH